MGQIVKDGNISVIMREEEFIYIHHLMVINGLEIKQLLYLFDQEHNLVHFTMNNNKNILPITDQAST